MSVISMKARSGGAFLQNSVGSISIAVSFFASVFVFGVPLCLAAGAGFTLFSLIRRQTKFDYALLITALISALFFGLISASLFTDLPSLEISKSALGVFLFFATLIIGPRALLMAIRRHSKVLEIMALVIIVSFLAEFFSVFSLKAVGLVNRFMIEASGLKIDTRPSGLFSEPSWHALAGTALAYYLSKSKSLYAKVLAFVLCVTCVMSGSSTGLALTLPVLYRLTMADARGVPKVLALSAVILGLSVIAALPAFVDFHDYPQIQKIIDPTAYGSGRARFSTPLRYIDYTVTNSPVFGMGLSYITEHLIGKTGAAVLPFNVFIQLGFLGIFVYFVFIVSIIIRYRSNLIDISCAMVCLFSLGLEGSPFQAILLVLFLCPYYRSFDRVVRQRGIRGTVDDVLP